MELPVQYTTVPEEMIKDLIKKECIYRQKQVLPTTYDTETLLNKTFDEQLMTEEIKKELVMKKWIQTVLLEKEILERELTHRNFNVQVDPTKRIVIVKVLTPCNTTELLKKVIRVPEHVNISQLKVRAIPEQKVVLIKAPFTQVFNKDWTNTECRMFDEELPMERVLEIEPTLYKMVEQMRRHLPTFFVPRVFRHLETGLLKVVLDMVCNREQMMIRPEDLLVKVHEIERCLAIKVLCDKMFHTRQQLDTPFFFQPREMCHKFMLPTFVNLAKINHFPISDRIVRIELPIIREQLRTGLYNNQWTRCL